jgi:hypothetical protein
MKQSLNTIIDNVILPKDFKPEPDEPDIMTMATHKIKLNSHGYQDKLKFTILLRGDIQNKYGACIEDKYSPYASFRVRNKSGAICKI